MYAELGACLGNGCLHVCGIGCTSGNWLVACMRHCVHVCGVGCVSGERLFGCMSAELGACLSVGCMSVGLPAELGACLAAGSFH